MHLIVMLLMLFIMYIPKYRMRFVVFFNKSSPVVCTDFAVLIVSVSSTNTNLVITSVNWDKHDKASKPKPSSLIMFSKIALIITHIVDTPSLPSYIA